MYQYPYGNAQQLNLDWILSKIQELEADASAVNIEEVANTLISATFDAGVSYRRYDYCFYNGKLYRALNDTSGAFNPADWLEVVIGDDIPVLTRLLNAVDTSLTSLQNTVNDLDSDDIDNASNVTGTSVSDALETLDTAITNIQDAVDGLDSDDVDNASIVVSGATVTAALDALASAISGKQDIINSSSGGYSALTDFITGTVASIKKYGKVVSFFMYTSANSLTVDSARVYNFLAINEGYRPSEIIPPIFSWEANGTTHLKSGGILPDGTVQIYFNPATDGASINYLSCDIVYIID